MCNSDRVNMQGEYLCLLSNPMSENKLTKTIQFDPALFSGKKTRKRKEGSENKTRKAATGAVNYTLLKEIRRNQMERNRQLLVPQATVGGTVATVATGGTGAFAESLRYFTGSQNDVPSKKKGVAFHPVERDTPLPGTLHTRSKEVKKPQYGCLKGGLLPSYRTWKAMATPVPMLDTVNYRTHEINQTLDLQQQSQQQEQQDSVFYGDKQQQKRHVRTYRVGKSKVRPHVSVLLSNKTIRRNVTTKLKELKKEPVSKVKQKLIRDGFVRMGTTAPENVLREIYENVAMIGDVKNYSPDIMLYNLAMSDK